MRVYAENVHPTNAYGHIRNHPIKRHGTTTLSNRRDSCKFNLQEVGPPAQNQWVAWRIELVSPVSKVTPRQNPPPTTTTSAASEFPKVKNLYLVDLFDLYVSYIKHSSIKT